MRSSHHDHRADELLETPDRQGGQVLRARVTMTTEQLSS
jgi:hypothetical protein